MERRYPGRGARKQKKQSFSVFFCQGIVNIPLCPAFPLLPFILQSCLSVFKCKDAVLFLTPRVHSRPGALSASVSSPVSLIFHLPQVSPDDITASTFISPHLPISHSLFFFLAVTLFQRHFKETGSIFHLNIHKEVATSCLY